VGAVTPLKVSPAPTFFGPSSAALDSSSCFSVLPTSACLNGLSQHANHCFQNLAVCFGEVHGILDKTVRNSRQRQPFKSFWHF